MRITDRIHSVATLKNAVAYNNLSDQFIFCLDLLEISANWIHADMYVNRLEDEFDRILEKNCQCAVRDGVEWIHEQDCPSYA